MISRLYESKNTTSEINMSNKKIRRIQIRFFINLLHENDKPGPSFTAPPESPPNLPRLVHTYIYV